MQRKNYDSEFCGSVPLNFVNQIQPHGILMVVKTDTLEILQVSQNIISEFGIEASDIVEQPLSQYLSAKGIETLTAKMSLGIGNIPISLNFQVNGTGLDYLAVIHAGPGYLLLELEKQELKDNNSFLQVYQDIKFTMSAIDATPDMEDAFHIIIKELKRISGFDKIMIYQFDEDWNGTVIAEIMEEGMESYMGLRFPASDIPKQARALYLTKSYRLIPDRDYTPVKLYPVINPLTNTFTDLSECNLRGVVPVHIEYLKNMEVVASMSTRIIKDGKLWGLISCHHRTAKFLNYETCSVFEMLSNIISSKLSSLQTAKDLIVRNGLQQIHSQLIEQIYSEHSLFKGLLNNDKNILDLLNLSGAIISHNKQIETIGNVPDINSIKNLLLWVQTNKNKIYTTSSLPEEYEDALVYAKMASGMIVIPLHADKAEYIIGLKPEVVQNVTWGGNPDDAITFSDDNKNYHPRNSFKQWQQTLRNNSEPWHSEQLAIAEQFKNSLMEYILKNAELDN